MKKVLLIGCIMFLVFCAPKKSTVATEGVEEVVVFGEETAPTESVALAPPTEEPMPSAAEGEALVLLVPPPIETPPVVEEQVTPPPVAETPTVLEEAAVAPTQPAPVITTAPAPTPKTTKVFGFRIQIFASSTEANAKRVADDARTVFAQRVYSDYVPPYYKVRVGDCLTRGDADALKSKAMKSGYRDAFVVETMITP